jgi:hypothetical protein
VGEKLERIYARPVQVFNEEQNRTPKGNGTQRLTNRLKKPRPFLIDRNLWGRTN